MTAPDGGVGRRGSDAPAPDLWCIIGMSPEDATVVVMKMAWHLCGENKDKAEDLFQEVFLSLQRKFLNNALDTPKYPTRWLCVTTQHMWINRFRYESRRPSFPLPDELIDLRDPSDGPEEAVIAAKWSKDVHEALALLSEPHQKAIRLVIFEGRSKKAAADILGLQVSTFQSRLQSALTELRRKLKSRGWGKE